MAVSTLLLATGCASGASTSPPPPEPQQSPAASPFLNSLERTKALGTARIDVTVRRDGTTASLIGSGVVDLVKGLGVMTWHDDSGWRTQLDNDRATFVKTDAWSRSDVTPESALADPLAVLGSLRVRTSSVSTCGDSRCTRHDGSLPVTSAALAAMGYPPSEVAPDRIDAVVEVDPGGRIISVTRTARVGSDAAGHAVSSQVILHDFGGPLDLTSPTQGSG